MAHEQPRYLVLKIALGVFLGMCAFGAVALAFSVLMMRAATDDMRRQTTAAIQQTKARVADEQEQFLRSRPLQKDEHCAKGRRYRQTKDGWAEMPYGCNPPP